MVLSNSRVENGAAMTEPRAITKLTQLGARVHSFRAPYLHSKLHYFETNGKYVALIGSANLTKGALVDNEELSSEVAGVVGDATHREIQRYLGFLSDRIAARGAAPQWVLSLPEMLFVPGGG